MKGDRLNPNEYVVYEVGNVPYSEFAVKYTLADGVATFWYWTKNPFTRRYELKTHEIKDVYMVLLTVDGKFT